jgi:cold-inducible RNA-binding protein
LSIRKFVSSLISVLVPKSYHDSTLLLKFPVHREKVNIYMSTKLYVGNLSFDTSVSDLENLFGEVGTVQSTNIIEDRDTGRSRGFGFVEMSSKEEAQTAISTLNGKEIDGRELTVNEAKPRVDRASGGGGGGRGGYGGGGRY